MIDSLIYSLNATVPIFLVIVLGYILKRINWVNDDFTSAANKLNFRITLPALLFQDLLATDLRDMFDLEYLLYCAIVTSICFWGIWGFARIFLKDDYKRGSFVQGSFRGSAAVLGTAFAINLYGNTGMVPLMIIGSVPLYNIYSVIVLSAESNNKSDRSVKSMIKGILTNPVIISIVAGISCSMIGIKFPVMVDSTLGSISKMATPLALIAIGAGFEGRKAMTKLKATIVASIIKLVIQPIIFLPIAIAMGFTDSKLVALVIMLGAPSTVSCYIMAKNMGNDGTLSSSIIVLTTLLSAFTITGILFVLKSMGLV